MSSCSALQQLTYRASVAKEIGDHQVVCRDISGAPLPQRKAAKHPRRLSSQPPKQSSSAGAPAQPVSVPVHNVSTSPEDTDNCNCRNMFPIKVLLLLPGKLVEDSSMHKVLTCHGRSCRSSSCSKGIKPIMSFASLAHEDRCCLERLVAHNALPVNEIVAAELNCIPRRRKQGLRLIAEAPWCCRDMRGRDLAIVG